VLVFINEDFASTTDFIAKSELNSYQLDQSTLINFPN